jgi:hypothetical protein
MGTFRGHVPAAARRAKRHVFDLVPQRAVEVALALGEAVQDGGEPVAGEVVLGRPVRAQGAQAGADGTDAVRHRLALAARAVATRCLQKPWSAKARQEHSPARARSAARSKRGVMRRFPSLAACMAILGREFGGRARLAKTRSDLAVFAALAEGVGGVPGRHCRRSPAALTTG